MIVFTTVATEPADLDSINDVIHDATADQNTVHLEPGKSAVDINNPVLVSQDDRRLGLWPSKAPDSCLVIELGQMRKQFHGPPDFPHERVAKVVRVDLRVYGVRSFWMGPERDMADPWMLNVVGFDAVSRQVRLDPVVGPGLYATVDELHVVAEVTDTPWQPSA